MIESTEHMLWSDTGWVMPGDARRRARTGTAVDIITDSVT